MISVNANCTADPVIRPIELSDARDVCALIQQLGYSRPMNEVGDWIQSLAKTAHGQAAFVAEIANEVIGWIEVSIQHRLQSAPFALIGGLVVKEGFRNQKIGFKLCEIAEAWSWERGIAVVRVTSRITRLDAHRFYENNGYSLTKVSRIFEKKQNF